MYHKILQKMQQFVQRRQYRTLDNGHVDEELDNDSLTPSDLRLAILNGGIIRRSDDEKTGGYQYRVCGKARDSREMIVVVRFEEREEEEWLVIITVWDTKKERGNDLQEQWEQRDIHPQNHQDL